MTSSPQIERPNPNWTAERAVSSFNGEGTGAEILKLLESFEGRDRFLNVGYSRTGQFHWGARAQLRLIDRLAKRMLRRSKLEPNLLDIGCGRGGPATRLHEKWKLDVTGVDVSEKNLEIARRHTRDRKILSGLTFKRGDARHLPIDSDSFSYCTAIESLAYVDRKPGAIAEVTRVLRPGGVFAAALLTADHDVVVRSSEAAEAYDRFLEVWDLHSLESTTAYESHIENTGLKLETVEIATRETVGRHQKGLARLVKLWDNDLARRVAASYLRKKADAELAAIRKQVVAAHDVLALGVLQYTLVWARKQV